MAKNSSKTPMKLANLERVVNRAMLIVLGTQALLALLSDVMYCVSKSTFSEYWYLYPEGTEKFSIILPDWLGYWFTFFILYCNLMPISLYAAMEVCGKRFAAPPAGAGGCREHRPECDRLPQCVSRCAQLPCWHLVVLGVKAGPGSLV